MARALIFAALPPLANPEQPYRKEEMMYRSVRNSSSIVGCVERKVLSEFLMLDPTLHLFERWIRTQMTMRQAASI
jgi:hypothetical protein